MHPRGGGIAPVRPSSASSPLNPATTERSTSAVSANNGTVADGGRPLSRPTSARSLALEGAVGSVNTNAALLGSMEGLCSSLRDVLSEQALRNVEALQV
jgi:hypothetical protein